MYAAHGGSGADRSARRLGLATSALAVTGLVLALCLGQGCGPSGEDASGGTGATTLGVPVSSQPGGTPPASSVQVNLLRVVDGDTIWVRMPDGMDEKVRYIGIDAPEVAHGAEGAEYLGDEAARRNARLLSAGPLELELDVEERDPYGRLLAYVWAGGLLVNEQLVLEGYARARDYPPNLSRQTQLRAAERSARTARVGLWAPVSGTT